jgi:hypothetical protein
MKRLVIVAALAAASLLAGPALAQFTDAQTAPRPPATAAPLQVGVTPISPAATPPAAAPAVTQNTVTTTGPVTSETTISAGTLAGQALMWMTTIFGGALASVLTAWAVRLFQKAGIDISDAASDRLQRIILNGINAGGAKVSQDVAGKGQVEIKNAVVAHALAYTQAHAADTIKALGFDPTSPAAIEAIKARIETAITDPAVPTPAILDKAPAAEPALPPQPPKETSS